MENLISDLEDKMQKTIASLNNEFKKIRTGRANPSMLDDIKIDYYGSPTPINQAASISVEAVSYTHLRAHETGRTRGCRRGGEK